MLVDSHCHLDYADYGADRDDVMRRARLAGVGTMLTISIVSASVTRRPL